MRRDVDGTDAELYAEYVFWLLHARTDDERANYRACSRILDARNFWPGCLGRPVRDWPECAAEYQRLCETFGRTPEAV